MPWSAIAIGIVAGAVGCFIILRGMFSSWTLSHTQFFLVWLSPLSWASISLLALLCLWPLASVLITYIKKQLHHQERHRNWDYLFFFPLRVILIGVAKSSTDLFHILFGNILAVQDRDMWITIGVGAAVLLVIVLLFSTLLLLTSFDPVLAQSMGVRVKVYHYLLMVLLTLVSVLLCRVSEPFSSSPCSLHPLRRPSLYQ